MTQASKRTVILISGRGSNMAALIDAADDSAFPAEIVGVISDKAGAGGLGLAASKGIATRVVSRGDFPSKEEHDAAIDATLVELGAEIVCLAGYMRLLTTGLVEKWQGRMINIHPALLPLLKGLDTHQRALDAGLRIHGCTVHFVTAAMDDGPIIAQSAVPVLIDDDERTLSARVLGAEHALYPMALRLVAEGKARMEGGRTVFADFESPSHNGLVTSPGPSSEPVDLEALARFTP
ncbi:phosphoribosylglycinamide formyltransferase-1 [Mesorhizobium soli]|uniref:phosphoribosylglycinamide formyltransferase n=1 Tax=Pseudaminobacter soli (ex Li et al. 2025) TaxID=1295366 RepID=UPI002475DCFA|nr:phosphoribosylglycinamide formyltransferase [Mesorhizobium soli]MDH6229919.1 phosphoribosylglycinamide formyltransferase-1 [Mesorhizobium soli]